MKKNIVMILIVLMVILSSTITYSYIAKRNKTEDHIIQVGSAEPLTIKFQKVTAQSTLIPYDSIATSEDEVTEILFWLYVTTPEPIQFKIEHDLHEAFTIRDWTPTKVYNTNEYNNIVLVMNDDIDISSLTFYLYIVII